MSIAGFWDETWTAALVNHLWQSTVVVAVAWLVTAALKKNHATVRYWVWFAASVKFLLPFSLLIAAGEWLRSLIPTPASHSAVASVVEQISERFTNGQLFNTTPAPVVPNHAIWLLPVLLAVWALGMLIVAGKFARGWWKVYAAKRQARPSELQADVPVLSSPTSIEPGIFGIFRPVLLLPEGIEKRLTVEQMRSIVAHEMCHARRRDNLTFALHMVVETAFWFHPFVWWIRVRLIDERERACDETVVQSGGKAEVYAESILNVCKFCVESPVACVSGVTGADLKRRIVRIMAEQVGLKLSLGKKVLLSAAASTALAFPILFAFLLSVGVNAQLLHPTGGAGPSFEVATIKPNHNPADVFDFSLQPARFKADAAPLSRLIRFAYDVKSDRQVLNMPAWANSETFDIDAKISDADVDAAKKLTPDQRFERYRLMVQSLLADRFGMKVRTEMQELPVYVLVVAKNGPKLTATPEAEIREFPQLRFTAAGDMKASSVSIAFFAGWLSGKLDTGDRVVIDTTELKGNYDFSLHWDPVYKGSSAGDTNANQPASTQAVNTDKPPLILAIQEQLGLKLEPRKGPVEVLVVDHVERPSAN